MSTRPVFQYRLRQAALSLKTVAGIIRGVIRRRQEAAEDAAEAWDRHIRQ